MEKQNLKHNSVEFQPRFFLPPGVSPRLKKVHPLPGAFNFRSR